MHPFVTFNKCFSLALLLLFLSFRSFAQPEKVGMGYLLEIDSEVFQETRQFAVYAPEGYTASENRYPILYVLDGEWNFHFVTGLVKQLISSGDIPPMLVVGVYHKNRNKELTPPGPNGPSGNFGGAGKLLTHLVDELHPYMTKQYRTQPYSLLLGHSFGGLFSLYAMREKPSFFQAILSLSPSLGRNDEFELQQAQSFFTNNPTYSESLFLALGNEGGATYYSTQKYVKELFEKEELPMRFSFEHFEKEDHISMTIPGIWKGLKFVFEGYNPDKLPAKLDELYLVESHFRMLSHRYGYNIFVPERYYLSFFREQLNEKEWDYAFYILERYKSIYPESLDLIQAYIDIHTLMGNLEEAEKYRGEAFPYPKVEELIRSNSKEKGRVF
ncbi:MAG: alpha/beta hydrolase-fold protein [Bacteroidota bacterium]